MLTCNEWPLKQSILSAETRTHILDSEASGQPMRSIVRYSTSALVSVPPVFVLFLTGAAIVLAIDEY
jgi:hypothetical protein